MNEKMTHEDDSSVIISMYKRGMSQKEISEKYGVCQKRTHRVLQKAGFDTSAYRRIPNVCIEIIYVLLRAGVGYRAAGEATDISFHAIRDIAERHPRGLVRSEYKEPRLIITDRETAFMNRYLAGECFCMICSSMNMSRKEILRCYAMITDAILAEHRKALRARLNAEDMNYNTVASLARKYGISASIVKAHLNS